MSTEQMAFIYGAYIVPAIVFFTKLLMAEIERGGFGFEDIVDCAISGLMWPFIEIED